MLQLQNATFFMLLFLNENKLIISHIKFKPNVCITIYTGFNDIILSNMNMC
jgi:hypothetical protein